MMFLLLVLACDDGTAAAEISDFSTDGESEDTGGDGDGDTESCNANGWLYLKNDTYSESSFLDDYFCATCQKTFACYDADTVELFAYGETADERYALFMDQYISGPLECDFQPDIARECIKTLVALSCDDYVTGNFPGTCSRFCT